MVKAGKVRLLLSEQIESQPRSTADEEYDNTMLATMLFSIPERVANATRAAPPPILAPSTFFRDSVVCGLRLGLRSAAYG